MDANRDDGIRGGPQLVLETQSQHTAAVVRVVARCPSRSSGRRRSRPSPDTPAMELRLPSGELELRAFAYRVSASTSVTTRRSAPRASRSPGRDSLLTTSIPSAVHSPAPGLEGHGVGIVVGIRSAGDHQTVARLALGGERTAVVMRKIDGLVIIDSELGAAGSVARRSDADISTRAGRPHSPPGSASPTRAAARRGPAFSRTSSGRTSASFAFSCARAARCVSARQFELRAPGFRTSVGTSPVSSMSAKNAFSE